MAPKCMPRTTTGLPDCSASRIVVRCLQDDPVQGLLDVHAADPRDLEVVAGGVAEAAADQQLERVRVGGGPAREASAAALRVQPLADTAQVGACLGGAGGRDAGTTARRCSRPPRRAAPRGGRRRAAWRQAAGSRAACRSRPPGAAGSPAAGHDAPAPSARRVAPRRTGSGRPASIARRARSSSAASAGSVGQIGLKLYHCVGCGADDAPPARRRSAAWPAGGRPGSTTAR